MADATKKPNLHQSALEMLSICGVRYEFRYIQGIKVAPGVAITIGKSTHRSVERDLKNVIEKGELLSVEEVKDIARDAFEGEWSAGVALDREEAERGAKLVKGEAVDHAVTLAELHRVQVAPSVKPTAVERQWVIELEGYPMNLAGAIDICEGTERIRDTKTAAKSPPEHAARDSLQLSMYSLAAKVIDGTPPKELQLDALVKSKVPKWVKQITQRTDEDRMMLMRRIERAMMIVEKGAFTPASPSDWHCSERFCGWWNQCAFARRPVTVSMSGAYPNTDDLTKAVANSQRSDNQSAKEEKS